MPLNGYLKLISLNLTLAFVKFAHGEFDYYLNMTSDLWHIQPQKDKVQRLWNSIRGVFIAEQTEALKRKFFRDINDEVNSGEFYGCFYSSPFIEYGPPITGNRYYNKDLCAWQCATDYTNCDAPRTLVGVFHRTGCICLCETEDLMGAKEAPKRECNNYNELEESRYEYNIILGGSATPFRVMTVCKSKTWGDMCERPCNCKKPQCQRKTGVCLSGACLEHYSGPSCELYDSCAGATCINGGTCVVVDNENYRCECPTQTYGAHCENLYDWAINEDSNVPSKELDFDAMVDDLSNTEFGANSGLEEISYFECLSSSDSMEEVAISHYNKSSFHIHCSHKCRHLGKTFTSFRENPEKCFCGNLEDISAARMNRSHCTRCKFSEKHFCGSAHVRSVYTSCLLGLYIYRQKCQNRCKCLKPVPCTATTGRCPSNLCLPGYYGTTCNLEDYNYDPYKRFREQGNLKLANFTCFLLSLLAFYVFGMLYWTLKASYNVFCVLPVEEQDEEIELEASEMLTLYSV